MSNISEPKIHSIAKYWAQRLATIGIKNIDIDAGGNITITYGDNTTSVISSTIFMEKKTYDPTSSGKVLISQNSELLNGHNSDYFVSDEELEIIKTAISDLSSAVDVLKVETSTNNTEIHNIIKGDHLSVENGDSIGLVKSTNGVIIDMTMLTSKLKLINDKLAKGIPTATKTKLGGIKVGSGLSITTSGVLSATGGGILPTNISISDVENLEEIFNGTYAIEDIKINGQSYKLNDFMTLAQVSGGADMIYVRSGGFNGDGSLFSPYSSLNVAFTALSIERNRVEILDSKLYNIPIDSNHFLKSFMGLKCATQGTVYLYSNNSYYHVGKHIGDIEIHGNNVTVFINEELQGDVYVYGNNATFFVNKWDNNTYTITDEEKISDGSKIGCYTYGYIARR